MSSHSARVAEDPAEFMHRWTAALLSNDVEQVSAFTTEDWVLIDTVGPIPRERFHAVVDGGELQHHTMAHDIIDVIRVGEVAIVYTHGRNIATFRGGPIEADEWTSNVLVPHDAGWRCILTQLTPRTTA